MKLLKNFILLKNFFLNLIDNNNNYIIKFKKKIFLIFLYLKIIFFFIKYNSIFQYT